HVLDPADAVGAAGAGRAARVEVHGDDGVRLDEVLVRHSRGEARRVGAGVADVLILVRAAPEEVVSVAAVHVVDAVGADQQVVAVSVNLVLALLVLDVIVAVAAEGLVAAAAGKDDVVAGAAADDVPALAGDDRVVAAAAVDDLLAAAVARDSDLVVTRGADDL